MKLNLSGKANQCVEENSPDTWLPKTELHIGTTETSFRISHRNSTANCLYIMKQSSVLHILTNSAAASRPWRCSNEACSHHHTGLDCCVCATLIFNHCHYLYGLQISSFLCSQNIALGIYLYNRYILPDLVLFEMKLENQYLSFFSEH